MLSKSIINLFSNPFFMKGILPDGLNTYLGLTVALAPTFASWFGYAPTPEFNSDFQSTVLAVITLIGTVYAAYGKLRHQLPTWFKKV